MSKELQKALDTILKPGFGETPRSALTYDDLAGRLKSGIDNLLDELEDEAKRSNLNPNRMGLIFASTLIKRGQYELDLVEILKD